MRQNFSDSDYDVVMSRILAAAPIMQNDGWWWQHAGLTSTSVRKQMFRKMLAHSLRVA
jgi:hypothetical protein